MTHQSIIFYIITLQLCQTCQGWDPCLGVAPTSSSSRWWENTTSSCKSPGMDDIHYHSFITLFWLCAPWCIIQINIESIHTTQSLWPLLGEAVGQRLQYEGGLPAAEGGAHHQAERVDQDRLRFGCSITLSHSQLFTSLFFPVTCSTGWQFNVKNKVK